MRPAFIVLMWIREPVGGHWHAIRHPENPSWRNVYDTREEAEVARDTHLRNLKEYKRPTVVQEIDVPEDPT